MKAGDRVRIKSREEIEANPKLEGSVWTGGMFCECGKFGKILKIVSEGDYHILMDSGESWYFPGFTVVSVNVLDNE